MNKKIIVLIALSVFASIVILSGCDANNNSSPLETQPPNTPVPTEYIGQSIADFAMQFLGQDYNYGGETPEDGFDCSGLIYYTYKQYGYKISRTAEEQSKNGESIEKDELLPGDVLCFNNGGKINHCGIYIGDGKFIHAMDSDHGIVITDLDYWLENRILIARRIIGVVEQKSLEQIEQEEIEYAELQAYIKAHPTPTPTPTPYVAPPEKSLDFDKVNTGEYQTPRPTATVSPTVAPTVAPTDNSTNNSTNTQSTDTNPSASSNGGN